jgi:DNA repair exonuclease SbcCD ATPase subunit
MIIKRLSASFGRLSNETLTLSEGLNIIEAPNESGKSTWCAFIKAILYGIHTSDRDKAGYLSDKTRYRPWNGAPMGGSMDIETTGISLTLERKSDGKLPMRDFSAVYTGTGTPYNGLYPDTAGDTLIGGSEAVFERSAFISQSGIKISQTPELEKRISSLVTTGDEASSYTEADERLRLWLRKRRFNKSGTIPALEEKLAGINKKLSHIESALDEAASMRLEAERLKKRRAELNDELSAFDRFDTQQALQRAREKYERAQAAYTDIYRELTKYGPAPTDSDLSFIRGDLKALESFKAMLSAEQKNLKNAQDNCTNILQAKRASAFDGPDASVAVQKAALLEQDIKKFSLRRASAVALIIIAAVFVLLTVITSITAQFPAMRLISAAAAVICAVLLLWRTVKFRVSAKKLTEYLAHCNVATVSGLQELYEESLKISAKLAEAESDVRSSEKSVSSALSMVDTILKSLREKLKTVAPDAAIENIESVLSTLETLLGKLAGAKAEARAAESFLNATRASGQFADESALEEITVPSRSKQEISSDLSFTAARFEELTNRYNMALGEIRAVGDPVILGSEKKAAEAELIAQKAQYDAISLAVETLKDANNELQTRFSPMLGETAGHIISRLTGGRYEKLTFDKTLDASAKTPAEAVSRNILTLSTGTADQIYLALRLAVCTLVLPKENPCPLILDDILTNFDDARAYLALDYLRELAQTRQILLFTCHKRETAYFSGIGDVSIIKLQ